MKERDKSRMTSKNFGLSNWKNATTINRQDKQKNRLGGGTGNQEFNLLGLRCLLDIQAAISSSHRLNKSRVERRDLIWRCNLGGARVQVIFKAIRLSENTRKSRQVEQKNISITEPRVCQHLEVREMRY